MKASVEWLNEYADIDVSAKELGDILTMTGSKVETIDDKSEEIKNVVVGKILEVKKHINAEKLVVTKVDVGNGEILQIVTGASNIIVGTSGQIVPVAKPNSILPGGKEIKTGKFDDKENINRLIDLIGEPIIQNHLRKLINEPKKNKLDSSQNEEMIRFLEKQKREIENKINELKKQ